MKTIYKILTAVILFTAVMNAQNQKYFDSPFGLGGGYQAGWQFTDTKDINSRLAATGFPALTTDGIFTSGGGGFIYVGFIPNLRLGGTAFGGAVSEVLNAGGFEREAVLELSGGGLTIEYTFPFIKGVGVSVGGVIGAGSMHIELYKTAGSLGWDGIWQDINQPNSANIERSLTNNYWHFSPMINIDIPFYRFFAFRIGGGYQMTFAGSWETGNEKEISGVPDGVNSGNFFLQSGIYIGFFSY